MTDSVAERVKGIQHVVSLEIGRAPSRGTTFRAYLYLYEICRAMIDTVLVHRHAFDRLLTLDHLNLTLDHLNLLHSRSKPQPS